MGIAYKNFWSLNTDEAVVAGILRSEIGKKNIEVLMPLNAQMKDVDLILMNIKNKKVITIQVKGSRAFEPRETERVRYNEGSAGFNFFSADTIKLATADYFAFLVYVIEEAKRQGRNIIRPHMIIIPTDELKKKIKNRRIENGNRLRFSFWIKPKAKEALDISDNDNDYSEYLDMRGFEKLYKDCQ